VTKSLKPFLVAGILVALGLAVFASPFASNSPDGLTRVAEYKGFSGAADRHAFDSGPVAGYELDAVEDERWSKGLSGLIGVVLTFTLGFVLFAALRAARARSGTNPPPGG
jgi:cobalt/nickel transport protein